jgi:hypothetical protein
MSSSKPGFFQITVLTLVSALLLLSVLAHVLDQKHSQTPCAPWEKDYWRGEGETFFRFDRVSAFFWSSLCGDQVPPLVLSASEGTVEPAFISYLSPAREFTGSHKGIKTFGYLAAHKIHPDRLKNLRALVFINPVYFSFAASTDSASIRLNAISDLAYVVNVHSLKQKWDAFVLDWFFVGLKSYFEEWRVLRDPPLIARPEAPPAQSPPPDEGYNLERNMFEERAHAFTSYRSRFSREEEPTRTLFKQSMAFARAHPDVPLCFVLLPINVANLRHFGRDAGEIVKSMHKMFMEIPEGHRLNLMDMNETPKLFMDPMHYNPWGVSEIMKRVKASDCAKPVLEARP